MSHTKKNKASTLSPEILALWQVVLDLAEKIRELNPWLFVNGSTLLGVRDPVSGETDWCSIMGQERQCLGIVIYSGQPGLARYYQMMQQAGDVNKEIDAQISQHAMVLIYNDKKYNHPDMETILQACGRRYRGAYAWPELCLHEPGFYPHPPQDLMQLRRVKHTMSCLLPMFDETERNPLWDLPDSKKRYWVSITDNARNVSYVREKLPNPIAKKNPIVTINDVKVARLRASGKRSQRICLFDWFPGQIAQDNTISDHPIILMVIIAMDLQTGEIAHVDMCPLWTVWQTMTDSLLKLCEQDGIPTRLIVRRQLANEILQPVANALDIELIRDERTAPMVQDFKNHINDIIGKK